MAEKLKVCWISAGVSSFMAGYLAGDVDKWIYIDIADQHEDSMRFIRDCEKAIGKEGCFLSPKTRKTLENQGLLCVVVFSYYIDGLIG